MRLDTVYTRSGASLGIITADSQTSIARWTSHVENSLKRRSVARWEIHVVATTLAVIVACGALALWADHIGAACLWVGNSGPVTHMDGPVSVATDHSIYSPDASIRFTVVNHLARTIYLVPPARVFVGANCDVYLFRLRSTGEWIPDDSTCAHSGVLESREQGFAIAAGGSLVNTVRPKLSLPPTSAGLAVGTYSLGYRFVYNQLFLSPVSYKGDVGDAQLIYSAPFRVCICARCG